jgi:hypothetical protein
MQSARFTGFVWVNWGQTSQCKRMNGVLRFLNAAYAATGMPNRSATWYALRRFAARNAGIGLGSIGGDSNLKRLSLSAFLLLPMIAACSGGSTTPTPVPEPLTPPLSSSSEIQSNAAPESAPAAVRADLLYIGNTGNNSITVYKHDAKGNTAPLRVIAGSKTGISAPGQLAEDALGNLYVANGYGYAEVSSNPAVLVFVHGANGNVAPIRKLTGFHVIDAMTVDKTSGNIFVFDRNPADANADTFPDRLLRFAPNASGNAAPLAVSAATLSPATQAASDSTGANIIEAHIPICPPCGADHGVATLPKQFANNATLNALFGIGWTSAGGVADDATTKTYLVSSGASIVRFAEKTDGSADIGNGTTYNPPIVSTITSVRCRGQLATPPGPTPYTYVVQGTATGCPTDAVYVFANNAAGNATPVRVLSGPATKLNKAFGIIEGK